MESIVNDEYFTKDLGEAAALICSSARLIRLQKEKSFFWFVFADKTLAERLSNEYWTDGLRVQARNYSDILRSLKDRLFAQNKQDL